MENIKSYERFNDYVGENWDADTQKKSLMSEKAKAKMKKLCEKHLIREAMNAIMIWTSVTHMIIMSTNVIRF